MSKILVKHILSDFKVAVSIGKSEKNRTCRQERKDAGVSFT